MKKRITSATQRTLLATVCAIILCMVLAAVLVFAFVPTNKKASAENEPSIWDGDLAAAGWDGDQEAPEGYVLDTTAKTLEIGSAAALAYFSHEVYADSTHALDGYTVTLTTDIDLNNKIWVPIGSTKRSSNPTKRFSGTFDGNGHKISNFNSDGYYDNIKYTAEDGYYVDVKGDDSIKVPFENDGGEFAFGLFGVTANITVKDLTLSNVNFDLQEKTVGSVKLVPDNVGAIIGHNEGYLNVENCVAGEKGDDSIIKIKTSGNPAIGGLVGRAYARKQAGSATTTTFESVKIEKSVNNINIEYDVIFKAGATSDQYGKVSGILGYSTSFKNCEFINCTNYGNLTGGQFVGGIMAFFSDNSKSNPYTDADQRAANAWVLSFDKCVNYGELTSSDLDTAKGFIEGKTYVGGITAHLSPSTDNYSSIISTNSKYNQLAPVNFYVTDCSNYGTIRAYNTEAKNSNTNPEGKGWNAAAGIIGSLTASETGENVLTNNYNYGNVESIAKEESTYYTPRMGGYIGWLYYYWGAELSTHPDYIPASRRPIDLTMTGGSSGQVIGENRVAVDNNSHVGVLIGSDYTYPNKPCTITLVDANGGNNITRGTQPTGEASVSIDAQATEIAASEYFGQSGLTNVEFAEDGALTTIGEWAFAGTGLTQVNLPASVEEIGQYAFGSDVYVIAKDKAHYDALVASDNVSGDIKSCLTYAVTIKYVLDGEELDYTEQKLFGQPYNVTNKSGKWEIDTTINEVGPKNDAGNSYVWYDSVEKNRVILASNVNAIIARSESNEITLYGFANSDTKIFVAREGLVYNENVTYTMGGLNSILTSFSDVITSAMTAKITEYNGETENLPEVIHNAGTYTVEIKEGEEKIGEFSVTIERATIDLANIANLSWNLTAIGDDQVNRQLNSNRLYIYTYASGNNQGKEYPSTDTLSAEQIVDLNLNSAYITRDVSYSVVRNRGMDVTVGIVGDGYTTEPVNDEEYTNVASDVGVYTAKSTVTSDGNYKFVWGNISSLRGMSIEPDDEDPETVVTVTKRWYIVDLGNWLITQSGADYVINDRVYGSTAAVVAPNTFYTGVGGEITMKLFRNNAQIGDESGFGVGDFNRYINRAMPAGEYRLEVEVSGVTSTERSGDGEDAEEIYIYHNGFNDTITFTVDKTELPSLTAVNAALKGKTFTFDITNSSSLFDNTAAQAVYEVLLTSATYSRYGTEWLDAKYDDLYGNFTMSYNLGSWQTDEYRTSIVTDEPDTYTVYYRISAPNYYSSIENLNGETRYDYCFTLIKYETLALPTVSSDGLVYTGSKVLPTIADNALYETVWNSDDAYIAGGKHSVSFKLYDSVHYHWAGSESNTVEVDFTIGAADNAWVRVPNIVDWSFETFDTQVNRIYAVTKFLDDGQSIKFSVVRADGSAIAVLTEFTVKPDGTVDNETLIAALNSLKAGSYKLNVTVAATTNYNALNQSVEFAISKSMNSWADGDDDLALPSWVVGKYNVNDNPIVVNAAHGKANIIITDIDGNEYYNSVTGVNKLNDCEVGKYLLKAWVDETEDFAALAERTFTIEVLDKIGLPWWGTLLITLGALALAALIIFILWKKGVFQILTEKIVVAIRTRASVDATIAAVRAAKKEDEARKTVAAAEARERAEARAAAAQAEKEKTAEERADALEAKAKAQAERAEKMRLRSEAMQARAERMREKAQSEQPAETQEEAAATETTETPTEE